MSKLLFCGVVCALAACDSSTPTDVCGGCISGFTCNAATSRCLPSSLPALGQPCDIYTSCVPPAACVLDVSATAGTCVLICEPGADGGCPAGQSCVQPFLGPDAGICATPVTPGNPCAAQDQLFCPTGQECLQFSGQDGGSCVARCDPTNAASCPELEDCLSFGSAMIGPFCAQTQPQGGVCAEAEGLFCASDALCIDSALPDGGVPATGRCYQDCSAGQSCPQGTSCQPTNNPEVKYCG